MDDDLDRPLGLDEGLASWSQRIRPCRVAFAIVALAAAGGVAFFALAPRGALDAELGGRPYALAKIEALAPAPMLPAGASAEPARAAEALPASSTQLRPAEGSDQAAPEVEVQNGVRILRAGGGGGANPLIIEVESAPKARLSAAPTHAR